MKYVVAIVPVALILGGILTFNRPLLAGPHGWYVVLTLILVLGAMTELAWRLFDNSDSKE